MKLIKIFLAFLIITSFGCDKISSPDGNNNGNGTSNLPDTTMLNVAYGTHSRQVYDIYLPEKRDSSTPIIFMLHGGAW